MIKSILLAFIILFIFTGCYKDNEQELYQFTSILDTTKTSGCDTSNLTYAGKIEPIIQQNCIVCHGSSYQTMGGGFNLQTVTAIAAIAKNNNRLYNAVTSTTNLMPKGGNKLSDCQILQIQTWVNKGAPIN